MRFPCLSFQRFSRFVLVCCWALNGLFYSTERLIIASIDLHTENQSLQWWIIEPGVLQCFALGWISLLICLQVNVCVPSAQHTLKTFNMFVYSLSCCLWSSMTWPKEKVQNTVNIWNKNWLQVYFQCYHIFQIISPLSPLWVQIFFCVLIMSKHSKKPLQ